MSFGERNKIIPSCIDKNFISFFIFIQPISFNIGSTQAGAQQRQVADGMNNKGVGDR